MFSPTKTPQSYSEARMTIYFRNYKYMLFVKGKLFLCLMLQGQCLKRRHQCDLPRVCKPYTHLEWVAQLPFLL